VIQRRGAGAAGVLLLLATVVAGAGCGRVQARSQGPECVTRATSSTAASPTVAAGDPFPDLSLPCLEGGRPVRLGTLGTPMLVNLWASWCGPCRQELPEFQRFAQRAGDRVRVVGVDTRDSDAAGRSLVAELHLDFAMLVDPEGRLLAAVGRTALPLTLFVDAHGNIRYLYNAQALDEAELVTMTGRYLDAGVP